MNSMTRADLTRRRLLDQARLAFAEKGYDGVSVQRDVLGPAGVSNGSFYHQFDAKSDLLVAVLEDAAEAGSGTVAAAVAVGATTQGGVDREAVRRGFEVWFDMVDRDDGAFRIQLRERLNPDPRIRSLITETRERWVGTLSAYLRSRGLSDPDRSASVIAMLTTGILVEYLDTPVDQRAQLRADLVGSLSVFVTGGVEALSGADAAP
jgi:TetR/AcrR family transcriptional repressor of nem operon